jgi:hypothetical protein
MHHELADPTREDVETVLGIVAAIGEKLHAHMRKHVVIDRLCGTRVYL